MLQLLLQLLCGVKKGNPCCQYSTIISTRGNEIFSISPAAALRTQISILAVKVSLSKVQPCVCVWTAVRRERSGAGYFSETPQWHCGSFRHHMCKRYGSCIPSGSALLTVFSFLIRLRAFVHAASSSPSTPSSANENLFFYMSTRPGWRSLSTGYGAERGKEKRVEEKGREGFWFRRRPGKSLCLFQL